MRSHAPSSATPIAAAVVAMLGTAICGAAAADAPTRVNADRARPKDLTTEELRRFRPLPLPRHAPVAPDERRGGREPVVETDTVLPADEPVPADPGAALPPEAGSETGGPAAGGRSKGTSGFPFTTTRVFPDAAVQSAPYRMAGKLFFRDPRTNQNFVCSASIIARRLILTAGHCVYHGTGRYWFTDFRFVPAYNALVTTQPFGQWTWSRVGAATGWTTGGGTLPSAGDFAIVELRDQVISGTTRQIGNYLGWFGHVTGRLVGNHVTALGYPANIDAGGRMIANAGEVRAYGTLAGHIGSSMTGGSSGGPWIEDFGVQGTGQLLSGGSALNRIVGVTSYGPANGPSPGFYQGSTILNDQFTSLRTTACAWQTGNC